MTDQLSTTSLAPEKDSKAWTPKDILGFLDNEIETFLSDRRRPGWTAWALLAALGSILWLLLQQLENSSLSSPGTALAVLVTSLGFNTLKLANAGLKRDDPQHSHLPRFRMTRDLSDGTLAPAFIDLIRYGTLAAIILTFTNQLLPIEFWCSFVFISVHLLTYLLILLLHTVNIPMRTDASLKGDTITRILALLTAAIGAFAAASITTRILFKTMTLAELRFGGLVTVGAYLFRILASSSKTPLVVSELRSIRRRLVFGQLDLSAALQHAEIAIHGLAHDDTFRKEALEVLSLLNELETHHSGIQERISAAKNILPPNPKDFSKEQRLLADSVLTDCNNRLAALNSLLSRLNTVLKALHQRRNMLRTIAGQTSSQTSLDTAIELSQKRVITKLEAIPQQLKELATSADASLHAPATANPLTSQPITKS
jgi:hypothetical protein